MTIDWNEKVQISLGDYCRILYRLERLERAISVSDSWCLQEIQNELMQKNAEWANTGDARMEDIGRQVHQELKGG